MIYKTILSILIDNNIKYEEFAHESVFSSADAQKLSLNNNYESKSMVLEISQKVCVVTVPPDKRINSDLIKQIGKGTKFSFLPSKMIKLILNVEVGAVSPFGYDKNIECYISSEFKNSGFINFNPGRLDRTIRISDTSLKKLSALGIIKFVL